MQNETRRRPLAAAALAVYGPLMLWLMFLSRPPWSARSFNLVPFATVRQFAGMLRASPRGQDGMLRFAVVNLAGNIVMFLPLGFLLPAVWDGLRRYGKTLLAGAGIVVLLELLQYAARRGAADIDDLILNSAGISLGYAVFDLLARRKKR